MTLRERILEVKDSRIASANQNYTLKKHTGLKWWEPESLPHPSMGQAFMLVKALFDYFNENKGSLEEILEAIQIWFPSFSDIDEIHPNHRAAYPYAKKGKADGKGEEKPRGESNGRTKAKANGKREMPERDENGHFLPKNGKPKKGANGKRKMPERDEHGHFLPKNKSNGHSKQPQSDAQTPQTDTATLPKPQTQRQEAPKPSFQQTKKPRYFDDPTIKRMVELIEAGLVNIWLVGPAGSGKTTICKWVADALELDITIIACGAGTTATTFQGYKYPEREATKFVGAFTQPGIIVVDEMAALEAQVAQILNSGLANDQLDATTGTLKRHPECIIVATSNTFGFGADRTYVANNQLDGATIDRFTCGILEVDYSRKYEMQFDKEVREYVWYLRDVVRKNGLRQIVSTRAIINAEKLKKAGLNYWKEAITANWTEDEKSNI